MTSILRKGVYLTLRQLGLEVAAYAPPERWQLLFDRKNLEQYLLFERLLDRVTDRSGIVVECGLGRLRTFRLLGLLVQHEGKRRPLWGFDSFQGLPEPGDQDVNNSLGRPTFTKGQWKRMTCEEARRMMAALRLDSPVTIVEGFFRNVLPSTDVPPIALLYLDVVLYDSYLACLEHLFPRVMPGGLVLLDEYDAPEFEKFPGARRAVDEYLARIGGNHRLEQDLRTGKWFIVKG